FPKPAFFACYMQSLIGFLRLCILAMKGPCSCFPFSSISYLPEMCLGALSPDSDMSHVSIQILPSPTLLHLPSGRRPPFKTETVFHIPCPKIAPPIVPGGKLTLENKTSFLGSGAPSTFSRETPTPSQYTSKRPMACAVGVADCDEDRIGQRSKTRLG